MFSVDNRICLTEIQNFCSNLGRHVVLSFLWFLVVELAISLPNIEISAEETVGRVCLDWLSAHSRGLKTGPDR